MGEIPDGSNFFSVLHTTLTKEQIAQLYGKLGWSVRKCSWVDYEIECEWAELVIDSDSPILMHGSVADVETRAKEIVAPLREAGIEFSAEAYGPEPEQDLLFELRS